MKRYVKSSTEEFDNIVYDLFDEYYLPYYDNELPEYEVLEYEWDIDSETYEQINELFDEIETKTDSGEIKIYTSRDHNNEEFLQLSDRHVIWDFDPDYLIDEEYISDMIQIYVNDFQDYMGVDLYLLGRSGRHVCVAFTLENIFNYNKLKSEWEKCEENFINDINSMVDKS